MSLLLLLGYTINKVTTDPQVFGLHCGAHHYHREGWGRHGVCGSSGSVLLDTTDQDQNQLV